MDFPKTLLESQFLPPRTSDAIIRSRLLERVKAFHSKLGALTFVLGPAGYGKSLLMAQVYDSFKEELAGVAWLSLDEDDNDVEQFFLSLIYALSQYSKVDFEPLLKDISDDEVVLDPRNIVQRLVAIVAGLEGNYALFLDDYHFIEQHPVHDALQLLLKLRPDKLFICISSRTELPLRVARLRARKQLLPIEVADLCFDKAESAELVKLSAGLELSPENLELLYTQTEGWPAIMQLAALALQTVSDTDGFLNSISVSQGSIAEFLAEEVADLIPENIVDFLSKASISERICSGLCEVLTGDRELSSHFNELANTRFLFQLIDGKGGWYFLNPLFRKYLLSRLECDNPTLFSELHSIASTWFEEHGFVAEAAFHAISAGEENRAFELLEERGLLLATQGHLVSLLNLVNKFPKESLIKSQELLIQLCWLLVLANKGMEAKRLLQELYDIISQSGEPQLHVLAEAKTLEATLHLYAEEHKSCQSIVSEWINKAPASPPHILAILHTDQALLYFDEYRYEDVLAEYRFVTSFDKTADTIFTRAYISSIRALVLMEQGRFTQARACYEGTLTWVEEGVGPTSQLVGLLKGMLSAVCFQQGDIEAAQRLIEQGGDALRSYGTYVQFMPSMIAHTRILQCQGENDRALVDLRILESLASSRKWLRLEAFAMHELVRFYLQLGEAEKAVSVYKKWNDGALNRLSGNSSQVSQSKEWSRLAQARLAVAEKAYPQAVVLFKGLIDEFINSSRTFRAIEAMVLLADCHILSGKPERAKAILIEALKLDEENSLIQVFRDEGQGVLISLKALLADLRHADKTAAHMLWQQQIAKVLADESGIDVTPRESDALTPPKGLVAMNLMEPLTKKEMQAMWGLLEGLSNKEIAEKMHVSINTVKTHLQTSYSKLGVSSRIQAVRRFKELGFKD